jgi:hypothetical protein
MVPAASQSYSSNNSRPHVGEDDDDEIIAVDPHRASNVDRYNDEEEDVAPPEQPRYKYSSQNMARNNKGRCRKYCCIVLMFLIFVGFSIGLSFLINYLFFRDDGSTGNDDAAAPLDLSNETFIHDKATVDAACSPSTFDQDGGTQCLEVCEPQFSACCKAFLESNTVNSTGTANATSSRNATAGNGANLGANGTKFQGQCSLEVQTRGCVSYSKCIAASGYEPAPTALPKYCSPGVLEKDPQACQTLCSKHKCCYDPTALSCLGDKLDICMDYAPCQNLRPKTQAVQIEPAPANLDQLCYYDAPDCHAACKQAECCNLKPSNATQGSNSTSLAASCFADNVVSCLTYAACAFSNKTTTEIKLPKQFSVVPKLPAELEAACDERSQGNGEITTTEQTCEQHCNASACCTSADTNSNCFNKDPLGCLAWDQYCQVNTFQGSPPS